jgi:acetylornithine/succinyldiaminopimelate/putrescine aminotransferase
MSTMFRFLGFLLATLAATHAWANDQRGSNAWLDTLDGAVSVVVGKLNPNQKQIIRSTAKDNLLVSLAEWAEDIQEALQH